MHMLEGCTKYVICFILTKYIVELKLFSLPVLNQRILGFDFGPDNSNRPCALNMDNKNQKNIRFSAAEMLIFVRYFGLLVGDFVPANEC